MVVQWWFNHEKWSSQSWHHSTQINMPGLPGPWDIGPAVIRRFKLCLRQTWTDQNTIWVGSPSSLRLDWLDWLDWLDSKPKVFNFVVSFRRSHWCFHPPKALEQAMQNLWRSYMLRSKVSISWYPRISTYEQWIEAVEHPGSWLHLESPGHKW